MIHPVFAPTRRLAFYVVAWVVPATPLAFALAGTRFAGLATSAALVYPIAFVYAFICLSAWYVCTQAPLKKTSMSAVLVNALATSLLSSGLWLVLARGWVALVERVPFLPGARPLFMRALPLLFTAGTLIYLLAIAVGYVIAAFEEARSAERRALELQVLAREAELKALRAQVDPHFLFNSLHSISALVASDPAGARQMCVLLGEFLRNSLRLGSQDRIALSDELGLANRFLEIERVRFGERLRIDACIDDGVGPCLVPPLLLQPLVENAVRHGVANIIEGGSVRLEARRDGQSLCLIVANPCDPEGRRQPRSGVGLDNVRKRLAAQYGQAAMVKVVETPDSFRVELRVPFDSGGRPTTNDHLRPTTSD